MRRGLRFYVYVIRDSECVPLYVGMSQSVGHRLGVHHLRAWFSEAASVTWQVFTEKDRALAAERALIQQHQPPQNMRNTERAAEYDLAGGETRRRHAAGLPCISPACIHNWPDGVRPNQAVLATRKAQT